MLQNAFAVGALTPSWWSFQHSPWWTGASLLHPQFPRPRSPPSASHFGLSGLRLSPSGNRSFGGSVPLVVRIGAPESA